jgi:hypothetical protein
VFLGRCLRVANFHEKALFVKADVAASVVVEAAGCELLGEITRVEEVAYAYRRFRGPDGRVYSLNERK